MKKIYYLLIVSILVLSTYSCSKNESLSEESVLFEEDSYQGDLDKWIMTNFTEPYNIEVKWKWDDNEVANNFWITPPQKEKAKAFLETMLEVWIKPYKAETVESTFLRKYIPKIIVLVGTPQYNNDASMTLGLAEGGRKITIFDIDNFDISNRDKVIKVFHVMHHEFAHIMHQTVFYPTDFKLITRGSYTSSWAGVWDMNANIKGFITPYSMMNEDEDFVELVAAILTTVDNSNTPIEYTIPEKDANGLIIKEKDETTQKEKIKILTKTMTAWEYRLYMLAIVRNDAYEQYGQRFYQLGNAKEGFVKLNKKLQIVTDYYKNVWNIDLYNLQKRIDVAVAAFIQKQQ